MDEHIAKATPLHTRSQQDRRGCQTTAGGLVLLELLGSGGVSRVFRGLDPIHKKVYAIKILRADLSAKHQSLVTRFENEARSFAGIDSPHIPQIEFITHEQGRTVVVMEYVDGPSLGEIIKETRGRKRFPENLALLVAEAIAKALQAVHAAGVIHRDVKPANIMLPRTPNGVPDPRRAKLIDFGVAHHPSSDLTGSGEQLGSLGYMAPEQIDAPRKVKPTADVFALGSTLYTMLAGEPAFGSVAPLIIRNTLTGQYRRLRELREPPSAMLCALVDRCLARRAQDRPANGSALLEALQPILRARGL